MNVRENGNPLESSEIPRIDLSDDTTEDNETSEPDEGEVMSEESLDDSREDLSSANDDSPEDIVSEKDPDEEDVTDDASEDAVLEENSSEEDEDSQEQTATSDSDATQVIETPPVESPISSLVKDELPVMEPESEEEQPERVRKSKKSILKTLVAVVLFLCVIAGAVYGAGVWYFTERFFPNTTVNGEDVSMQMEADLSARMSGIIDGYALRVTGQKLSLRIPGENIDVAYDGEAYARSAMDNVDPLRWPLEIMEVHAYTVDDAVTYDDEALRKTVASAVDQVNKTAKLPVSATIDYVDSKKRFAVVSEEAGTALDYDVVMKNIQKSVVTLTTSLVLDADSLQQPEVTSDAPELSEAAAKANTFVGLSIPLTVNDETVETIDGAFISKWVVLDDELDASLDEDAVMKWALGDFSQKCDTLGAKRTYKLGKGKKAKKVTVSGGTYGWVIDGESLADELIKRIKKSSSKALAIPTKSEGKVWNPGGKDWDRYIDIDLTDQVARLINKKGKVLWESSIVSGSVATNHQTPTGVYVVNSTMGVNQTLIGSDENGDGKPDYKTPVSYWIPFIGNSIALHDANWRSSFGGSIYQTNGSHGCVNLPPAAAAALYGMVSVGDVVSCHY